MAIVPKIEGDCEPGVFGDKHLLYLTLNGVLDEDLLPQAADFSIVRDEQSLPVVDVEFRFDDRRTCIVFTIDGEIDVGQPVSVRYKPTDWFMCDRDTGDSVDAFQQQCVIRDVSELPLDLHTESAISAAKVDVIQVNATLCVVGESDIQIAVEAQLNIAIAPQTKDFTVVQAGRVFDIAEIAYVKGQYGADIFIGLKKALSSDKPVVVEYSSAEHCLKTADDNAIADFSLSTRLEAVHDEKRADAQDASHELDTWAKFDTALVKDEANDSDIHPDTLNLDDEPVDLTIDTHDVDEELQEVDELIERFETEVKKSAQKDSVDEFFVDEFLQEELVEKQDEPTSVVPEIAEQSNPEAATKEDTNNQEHIAAPEEEQSSDIDKPEVSDLLEDTDLPDQLVPADEDQEEDEPADEANELAEEESAELTELQVPSVEELPLPEPPAKAKVPLSWTARVIYLIPIIVFVWLVVVGFVFVATMVYDIDLSFSGGTNASANLSAREKADALVEERKARRKSCKRKSQDGGTYDGQCVDGLRDGHGVYTWPSGNRYIGEWSLDRQNGKGTLILTSGAVYEGEFRAGLEHGQGKMTWPNGAWYEGSYEKGKFHGSGVYVSAQGNRYEGVFRHGSMTKNGTCVTKSGKSYFGPCKSSG